MQAATAKVEPYNRIDIVATLDFEGKPVRIVAEERDDGMYYLYFVLDDIAKIAGIWRQMVEDARGYFAWVEGGSEDPLGLSLNIRKYYVLGESLHRAILVDNGSTEEVILLLYCNANVCLYCGKADPELWTKFEQWWETVANPAIDELYKQHNKKREKKNGKKNSNSSN
jgi:hypothetical protein